MKKINHKSSVSIGLISFALFVLALVNFAIAEDGPPGGPPPAMPVKAMVVTEARTSLWSEYSGRLEAVDYVELRPQVSGTIKEVRFNDGALVKKGDVLFVIDPAPFEAAAAQANAELAAAKSQTELSEKQLARAEGLMTTNAISKDLLDERQNAARVAKNSADAAAARLRQAKINIDYAYVKAPIAGRVGRAEVTKGNLVQAGPGAPLLTTLVSSEGIYADFEVDEETYMKGFRNLEADVAVPVKLTVRGDTANIYEGVIQSFDNRINTATGTIRARALFKNEDGALLPGMFATVKMGSPSDSSKIMIPERVIGTDQDRKFVYVIDDSNKIVYREVKLGASVEGQRVVESGLKVGEKIVAEGIIRLRPDMTVIPQMEGEAPAGAPPTDAPPVLEKIESEAPSHAKE